MFKLATQDTVRRESDGAFIPADPANRDYAEYQKWCDATGKRESEPGKEAEERAAFAQLLSAEAEEAIAEKKS